MDKKGFSQIILLGIVALLIAGTASYLFMSVRSSKISTAEKLKEERSIPQDLQDDEKSILKQWKASNSLEQLLYNPVVKNIRNAMWAGYQFEAGVLDTRQYRTDGNEKVSFTENGFYAPSFSMPRSVLRGVNLNQKIKVKITGEFSGKMESSNETCTGYCITTERYHFSEFASYIADETGLRRGLRVLGTRQNVIRGNDKSEYRFTDLTVENTGTHIVVTDSSGFQLIYDNDFKTVTADGHTEPNRGGKYGELDPSQKWFLVINCHVNGEGFCKLDIEKIIIE